MNIKAIQDNETYKQVIEDSFGGVLYNVDQLYDEYQIKVILGLWDALSASEKESVDGVMKGAINFLQQHGSQQ